MLLILQQFFDDLFNYILSNIYVETFYYFIFCFNLIYQVQKVF